MISLPALVLAGAVGACTPTAPAGQAYGETPAPTVSVGTSDGRSLVEAIESPASPPMAAAASVEAKPLNSDWLLESGEREVISPDDDFTAHELPKVATPSDEAPLRLEVGSPVTPTQADVVVFDELDASGVPLDEGREIHCLQSDDCSIEYSSDGISMVVPLDQDSAVVVLHLYYAVVPSGGAAGVDVETNYASYGWKVS